MKLSIRGILVGGTAVVFVVAGGSFATAQINNAPDSVSKSRIPSCTKLGADAEPYESKIPAIDTHRLVNSGDAAIAATVLAVSEQHWNSADGKQWCNPEDPSLWDGSSPRRVETQLREVQLKATEILFSSEKLKVSVGDTLTVLVPGDAPKGTRVEIGSELNVEPAEFNRVPEAGATGIFVLRSQTASYKEGLRPAIGFEHGGMGVWRVAGERAVSPVPGRDAPVRDLKQRVVSDRKSGSAGARKIEKSTINPLG